MSFILLIFLTHPAGPPALVPLDAVDVMIWRQPDLSGKFYVDIDTTIKLPLLGKIDLKNKTLDSLKKELFTLYQNFLGETFLTINVYYRIGVLGEVRRAGIYYIMSNDRIPNLLAEAQGVTEKGNLRKVRILRVGQEKTVNVEKILKKGKPLPELELRPGDLVIVPRRKMPSWQELSIIVSTLSLGLNLYVAFFK
ncbi:MAG: polysaccharide biosynthesis/export family protein [candidate division WOR-3 bacterium]